MALCKLKNWIFKISRKTLKKMWIQKIFREKISNRGEFEPPPVPLYRLKNQNGVFDGFYKIFVKFGLKNWKRFILVAARCWCWTRPFARWSFRWSVAYRRHITQTPDIPLRRFGCPDLSPCSGDGTRAHFSGCLPCWSARAWQQNFRAQKLKSIVCEYLHLWTRTTPKETREQRKAYKYTYRYN